MHTGLFSTALLRAHGLRTRDIRDAVTAGTLSRLRRGWYATTTTPAAVRIAARVGGRLTCLAALRMHGCWVPEPIGIHVRVADGVSDARVPGTRVHWTAERVGPGVDNPQDALASALICSDLRALVVIADSLVNRRIISPDRIRAILATTPRGRHALGLHDPRAESGIETLVRLGLRRHRVRSRSQVWIPGVGRVDFLIGDRLVIEADGYEWHADPVAFERDRERDRELVRRGYLVVRASYTQVMRDLDAVMLAGRTKWCGGATIGGGRCTVPNSRHTVVSSTCDRPTASWPRVRNRRPERPRPERRAGSRRRRAALRTDPPAG